MESKFVSVCNLYRNDYGMYFKMTPEIKAKLAAIPEGVFVNLKERSEAQREEEAAKFDKPIEKTSAAWISWKSPEVEVAPPRKAVQPAAPAKAKVERF